MRRRWPLTLGLVAVALLFLVPSSAGYYTDWLWFRDLGYEGVFLRTLNAQALAFAATFAAVFVFLYVNLVFARQALRRPQIMFSTGRGGPSLPIQSRQLTNLALPAAAVLALLFGLSGANNWLDWLNFFNAVPFGSSDPLLHLDASFYVFRLPVWQSMREQALFVSFLALIGCGVYYVLSGSFVVQPRPGGGAWPTFRLVPAARRHLALLAAVIFGLMAWGAWLDRAQILITPASILFGASYTDVHAEIPFLIATMVVLFVGAALSLWHGFGGRPWAIPLAIALYFVVSIVGALYAAGVQSLVVSPNEASKELPYIQYNIDATRRAFALDRIDERELSGDAELTPAQIAGNVETIENVRLWDHMPLLQTFSQIQEIRTYYDFVNVDNDRYILNGKERQVMLSARELNTDSLTQHSFVLDHLTFTHGYGLTLGPVNQVTTDGLPVLFIRDLPPVTTVNLPVNEPSIYFGEQTSAYALVRTSTPEFHYPKGTNNVTTYYQGSGGVPIGGFLRRLAFALRFGTTDILVTSQINRESRILFHRKISERVDTLAPFLTYDTDPYPVVSNGRIFWIQDAYTATSRYPYSSPPPNSTGPNYIRNSVKVVIDAFNGTTTFYLAEPADPMIQTMARVFPGLLRPLSEMPADLRSHVRYPEDIFRLQAAIYTTYHMINPGVFYTKEDQWQFATLGADRNPAAIQPYYTIMKLPGEKHAEFVQILPFTPKSKPNLSAWMVARSDASHYGHMLVFQFPKQKLVYGPSQIEARINQDQIISPQITLWNQQGSEVIWGTLLVIPIEESLLYVRPLYLRSPEGKIPELKRVIVAYQSQIVMADTLSGALVQIFGRSIANALPTDRLPTTGSPIAQPVPEVSGAAAPAGGLVEEPSLAALAGELQTHYDRAQKALREGDFTTFGEEWKAIGEIARKMDQLKK